MPAHRFSHPFPARRLFAPGLVLLLLQGCSDAPAPTPQDSATMRVTTLLVRPQEAQAVLELPGRIVARQPMQLLPAVHGLRVEAVLADAGELVKAGQPLVQLDTRSQRHEHEEARQQHRRLQALAEAAQAQLGKAEASLALARATDERYRLAVATGAVSQQDQQDRASTLAQQEEERSNAAQQAQAARSELAAAAAKLAQAQQRLDETLLRAPSAGRLFERHVERGMFSDTASTTPWFLLAADGDREFEAWADVQRLAGLAPGAAVSVQLEGQGLALLQGKLRSVETGQGQESRRARLRIALQGNAMPP
ncbi:efflux RND transporter periplasmic adaptor subunit, partial [Paucibacter sp. XJ19-41]|uniref:efflux RND transporter periplasmic adaptor subunit n=1 Tax=Paucibacter sp. XJ19-41 TaxID=2927824 RepID=UPI00234B3804